MNDNKQMVVRDNLIEVFEDIEKTISEMTDIKEVLNTRNMAKGFEESWKAYYRSSGLGFDQMFMGWEAKIISERKMGEMLRDMDKAKGGQPYQEKSTGNTMQPVDTLDDLGISKSQSSRYQQIANTDKDKFDKVIAEMKRSFIEPTTKGLIASIIGAHVGQNSGENEWYTPEIYIESARFVMSKIDLDPASSDVANETVKATNYYTEETNGLKQKWNGNIWLNPPYAQPLIEQFCDKLIRSFLDSDITQACVLVNNATETVWGQKLLEWCSCICFPKGRIKFIDKDGNATGTPLQGQMILYFGEHGQLFDTTFSKFGKILWIGEKYKTGNELNK